MAVVIETKNLTKYYGKVLGVKSLDLEIKEGEIFGFLGPNGAGKTTTIRCLMDFVTPTSGSASILGMDCQKKSAEIKRNVGFLAGEVKLYDKLTGWEHINYIQGFKGKAPLLKDLIKRLKFDPKIKIRNLSKGNKQKLALILALMHKPKVLIMDEPTSGLDPILQNEIYGLLEDMESKGSTIFFSSHIISEVERIADQVGIIKEGKLSAIESIDSLANKKIRNIEIRFHDKYNLSDFKLPGTKNIEKTDEGVIISYVGDINPIIKKLASYSIADVRISHATLEDIFLEFYRNGETND
jgi:ABC-2 type transport system ATP-binding protein